MTIKKLPVEFSYKNHMFVAENKELHIYRYADSLMGLFMELHEDFNVIWKEVALEKDENLTPEGRELKKKVLEYKIHD